jgi:signal transduction histidine kinase/DNA-binding response OmpR family regulator
MADKLKNMYKILESKVEARTKDLEEANMKLENLNKQLLEANNAKSAFLASMSHELRTPLNAIIGFSELLRDGFLGELTNEQKEPVNDIYNSGKHLLTLINDILDLSKVEAGKVELVLEDTDLPILLSDALSIVKERAMKHSITLNSEIRKEIGKVKIDSVRVKQIVYNLLSNAVKFTPDKGKVTLLADIVSVFEVLKNKDKCGFTDNLDNISRYSKYIMIGVKDTGIGLPVDKMDRLFKSFEQLHNTNLNKTEGTGLGLSLVKKLVELHNGTVIAESKVFGANKGSTFTVFIPFVVANGSNKLKIADEDKISSIDKHVHKALIVEDDTSSARLLSTYLQDLKFYPEIVYNANDAIKALSKNKYDIVTLDIFLPDKNGWDLLKELKSHNLLQGTDIIIISIEPDTNKGIIMGVSDIMEKPINRKEFVDIVNRLKSKKMKNIKKILIVDDDITVLEYCKKILSGDFEVECALSGKEALEKINQAKPDILILDLLMPKMDGFEVLDFIKKDKRYENIPVVILTNKDLTGDELKLLNNKIESIFAKSQFNKESFVNEIKEILNEN